MPKEREEGTRITGWEVKSTGWGSPPGQLHPEGLQRRPGLVLLGIAREATQAWPSTASQSGTRQAGPGERPLGHLPGGLGGFCCLGEEASLQASGELP